MRNTDRDKSRFPIGPSVDFREVQRLKDEDSVLETSANIKVTGAVPEFIGVPAGIQQFYTAPTLVNNVINMNTTLYIPNVFASLSPVQDYGNVFGNGSASIVAHNRTNPSQIYCFNFVNGSLSSVPIDAIAPTNLALLGMRLNNNLAVLDIGSSVEGVGLVSVAGGSVTIPYFKNGSSGTIVVNTPAGYDYIIGSGIAKDGQDICVVWQKVDNTTKIRTYSTSGTMTGESSEYLIANTNRLCYIDNGMIAFPAAFSFKFLEADTSVSNTLVTVANGNNFVPTLSRVSENFTSDGYYYYVYGGFVRYNLNNNTSQIFPDILTRNYNTSPPTSGSIIPYVVIGIDSNNFLIGGNLSYQGYYFPIYCAVKIVGSDVYISDSLYNNYFTTSSDVNAATISSIAYTNGGNVVYTLYTNAPYDDYLILVDGPS